MEKIISTKLAGENLRKKRIDATEIIGLTSVMIALFSFAVASAIEIFRGTFSVYNIIELIRNFSSWSCVLLTLWGFAIATLGGCIIFLAYLINKK